MENAAKALEIAAGVLLGVLLLSLIAYFFSIIGEWPESEEDTITVEQLAKFNLEYEVYEKNAMYGVDVISCLNKAISNNEKYVEGEGFLSGTTYGKDYEVDVCIAINEPLEELIEVYYFSERDGKEVARTDKNDLTGDLQNANLGQIKEFQRNGQYDLSSEKYYTNFKTSDLLYSHSNSQTLDDLIPDSGNATLGGKRYYSLLHHDDGEVIKKLLKFSVDNPKVTLKNNDSSTLRIWSTVTWTTALYDFKTKKFQCDSIEYNESTGRVNKIYFSEK